MNAFDIFTAIFAVIAIVSGWRNGFISQLLSIGSILAGIYLASRYGAAAGSVLKINEQYAHIAGFIAIFLASLIAATLLAKLLGGLFSAVGLGGVNALLGIVLSLLKYGVVLSVAYVAFWHLNEALHLVDKSYIDSSLTFHAVRQISDYALQSLEAFKNIAV